MEALRCVLRAVHVPRGDGEEHHLFWPGPIARRHKLLQQNRQNRVALADARRAPDLDAAPVGVVDQKEVGLRALPDSNLVATQVGTIRRVVCASPAYLEQFGRPRTLDELEAHRYINFNGLDAGTAWTFATLNGELRQVPVHSRMTVSTADAAVAASIFGLGLTRVLSYQVADALRDGRLVHVLAEDKPPAVPASRIYPGQ